MKPATLAQTLQPILSPFLHHSRWVVAYSGGLDSTVLLHVLATMKSRPELCALHIHHGLQEQADQWLQHCETVCERLGVSFSAVRVTVNSGAGPEAAARAARYQAFSAFLQSGELLFQAHHLDDQIETLFLRLLRGTGIDGMQGIPMRRDLGKGELLRPLLSLPRAELEQYAGLQQLSWVEDPSNADARFDRNFLRQRVLPLIEERWPAYRDTLARFSVHAAESVTHSAVAVGAASTKRTSGFSTLALGPLESMAEAERKSVLRHWLLQADLRPSAAQLAAIQRGLVLAAQDAEPLIELGAVQLRRFDGQLHITALPAVDAEFEQGWDFKQPLLIPGAGTLSAEACASGGLAADQVLVRFRRGGERCQPSGRGHSQTLKKLLQEYRVEPWRRDRLPLLYVGDQLAAVADLWVCEGFASADHPDSLTSGRWQLSWSPQG